jgi:hypothetical protein
MDELLKQLVLLGWRVDFAPRMGSEAKPTGDVCIWLSGMHGGRLYSIQRVVSELTLETSKANALDYYLRDAVGELVVAGYLPMSLVLGEKVSE